MAAVCRPVRSVKRSQRGCIRASVGFYVVQLLYNTYRVSPVRISNLWNFPHLLPHWNIWPHCTFNSSSTVLWFTHLPKTKDSWFDSGKRHRSLWECITCVAATGSFMASSETAWIKATTWKSSSHFYANWFLVSLHQPALEKLSKMPATLTCGQLPTRS